MQIIIGPKLSNSRVRLDYKQSPYNPKSIPGYTIHSSSADEFVQEYNSQEADLNKLSIALTFIGMFGGYKSVKAERISKILIGAPIGALTGFLTGAFIAHNQKNKLMDKYNVEEI